jgi:hypothetical protein
VEDGSPPPGQPDERLKPRRPGRGNSLVETCRYNIVFAKCHRPSGHRQSKCLGSKRHRGLGQEDPGHRCVERHSIWEALTDEAYGPLRHTTSLEAPQRGAVRSCWRDNVVESWPERPAAKSGKMRLRKEARSGLVGETMLWSRGPSGPPRSGKSGKNSRKSVETTGHLSVGAPRTSVSARRCQTSPRCGC